MLGSFQIIFHGNKVYSPIVTSIYSWRTVLDIVREKKFKTQAQLSGGVQCNCGAEKAEDEIYVYTHTHTTHSHIHTLSRTNTSKTETMTPSELELRFKKGLQQGWGGWFGGGGWWEEVLISTINRKKIKYLDFQYIYFVLSFT